MIRSYDFLIHAYKVPAFKEEIIQHIKLPSNSEIIFDFAIIRFDHQNKMIREYPNTGIFLASKVFPMELSYDTFFKIMDSKDPWLICEKECRFLE